MLCPTRLHRRYGLGGEGGTAASSAPAPPIPTIEEELEATLRKIDIKDFDYKPVPRTAEELEEE